MKYTKNLNVNLDGVGPVTLRVENPYHAHSESCSAPAYARRSAALTWDMGLVQRLFGEGIRTTAEIPRAPVLSKRTYVTGPVERVSVDRVVYHLENVRSCLSSCGIRLSDDRWQEKFAWMGDKDGLVDLELLTRKMEEFGYVPRITSYLGNLK